jgi:hypothetical protein
MPWFAREPRRSGDRLASLLMSGSWPSAGGGLFDLDAGHLLAMFRRQLRQGRTVVVRQTLSMPDNEHVVVRVRAEVPGRHATTYEAAYTAPWRQGEDQPDRTGIDPPEAAAGGRAEVKRTAPANGNHVRKPDGGSQVTPD